MSWKKMLPNKLRRFGAVETRATELERRVLELEEKTRFLVVENLRVNQVLREIVYRNRLSRSMTGSKTRGSFDYQWKEIPDGKGMPSDRAFLEGTPAKIVEWSGMPRDWFKGKRVLDAGCGSGRWTWGLLTLGADVTAIDQSENALERAGKLIADVGKAEFLRKDILALDLEPGSFDLVWNFGVCHHTENLLLAMENVTKMVRPGGQLFMMLYGYPLELAGFRTHADYEEWRQRLLPLSFEQKVQELRMRVPAEEVHGYFDAVSPLINDLVTWEWIQAFLVERGFEGIRRTAEHPNHHFAARRERTEELSVVAAQ